MRTLVREREIPHIDSHTAEFLENPNSVIGSGAERLRMANGRSGAEFFSYETVRGIFRDSRITPRTPQLFLDKGLSNGPIMDYLIYGNLNLTWPEIHDRLRPILVKGFNPRRIAQAREHMRQLAAKLVDELADRDSCNIVTEFSHHLSIGVISHFIGIPPEDVPEFDQATVELRLLGQEPFWPGVPRLEQALRTVRDYSEEIVARRRRDPQEDYISDLIRVQAAGDRISVEELVWNIAGILLAGHDTTRYQLASCVRAVAQAGQWDTLAERPELVPTAIVEAMRMYPATPRQVKIVNTPLTIEDTAFEAGEVVTLNVTAAGRDPEAFPNPDRLDLHREEPPFDVGFGYGPHYCLGFGVAQAEMDEALWLLTRRGRDVEADDPAEIKAGGVIAGPEVIQVRYRATSA